jgi:hypothetical protein
VRFERSAEEWGRLLSTGVLFFYPARLYLIERGSRPVAYLGVALLEPAASGSQPTARVLELAGDRRAIAEAAPALRRNLGAAWLEIVVPPHDEGLEPTAAALGLRREEIRFPFVAAWWNPVRAQLPLPFYGFNYV